MVWRFVQPRTDRQACAPLGSVLKTMTRSSYNLDPRTRRHHAARWLARSGVALLGATLLLSRNSAQESVPGQSGAAVQHDVGNFSDLAREERLAPSHPQKRFKVRRLMPKSSYALPVPAGAPTRAPLASTVLAESISPSSPITADSSQLSPPPSASFLALGDDGTRSEER